MHYNFTTRFNISAIIRYWHNSYSPWAHLLFFPTLADGFIWEDKGKGKVVPVLNYAIETYGEVET
jgi:hypothetical protein